MTFEEETVSRLRLQTGLLGWLRLRIRDRITANLIGTLALQGLGVVTGIVLARVLGPTHRGALAAVLLWTGNVMAWVSLSLPYSITYFAARSDTDNAEVLKTGTVMSFVLGAAAVAVSFIVLPLTLSHDGDHALRYGLIYAATMPVLMTGVVWINYLNGLGRFWAFNVLILAGTGITAILQVALAVAGWLDVGTAVFASAGGALVTSIAAWRLTRGATPASGTYHGGLARQMVSYSWRAHISQLASGLNHRFDQLVISVVLTSGALGLYVVAWTVSSVITFAGVAIGYATLPEVAAKSQGEPADRLAAIRRAVAATLLIGGAGAAILVIGMPVIVHVAFGTAFAGSVTVGRLLAVAAVILAAVQVATSTLLGLGHAGQAAIAELAGLVVTAVGLAVTLSPLGIIGAAWTSIAAYTTVLVVSLYRISRILGLSPRALLFRT